MGSSSSIFLEVAIQQEKTSAGLGLTDQNVLHLNEGDFVFVQAIWERCIFHFFRAAYANPNFA